jgi:hypothetical protein
VEDVTVEVVAVFVDVASCVVKVFVRLTEVLEPVEVDVVEVTDVDGTVADNVPI